MEEGSWINPGYLPANNAERKKKQKKGPVMVGGEKETDPKKENGVHLVGADPLPRLEKSEVSSNSQTVELSAKKKKRKTHKKGRIWKQHKKKR